jgi:hypothetical protein
MSVSVLCLAPVAYCGALNAVALFPASGAQQVCTDTPLALTFDQPPQLGSAGIEPGVLGAMVDTSQRLPCSRQLTDGEAAQFSDPAFVLNGWVPTTINGTPAAMAPGSTTPGSAIIVNWSAPTNHASDDWVGLYRAGTPDNQARSRQLVSSGTTGALSFALPPTPGRYEFRYFAAGGTGERPNRHRLLRAAVNAVRR